MSEHYRPQPEQLSFLAPDDVELLTMMRRLLSEASRIYEARSGLSLHEPVIIQQPRDVFEHLRAEMGELSQEQLRTVTVVARQQVLSTHLLYQGTVSGTPVRVAEVFRPAILDNATGLFVVHNHPSRDPTPSPQDIYLTEQLRQAGKILDIELMDHLIIAGDSYTSLRERGLGFSV